jgi:hypothetical protein
LPLAPNGFATGTRGVVARLGDAPGRVTTIDGAAELVR